MTVFDAVVFDLDGVLIDSEPLWRDVEVDVFGRLGVGLTHADARETMGMAIDKVVDHWFERRPWTGPSRQEVLAELLEVMEKRLRVDGRPRPGAHHAVAFFADRGLRLGLASSSPHRLIVAALDRLALADRFEAVCSAEDEEHGKPHPDVYLTAASELDVAPARCVAVEDSERGVAAAKAAGMTCVAVPEDPHAPEPGLDRADAILSSLEELEPQVWADLQQAPGG